MSPRSVRPSIGAPPTLKLVHGGRKVAPPASADARPRAALRLVTPPHPRAQRAAPFERYRGSPRRPQTHRWVLATALVCWLILGWTLVAGVFEPIGRGVVREGTQSLFAAIARVLPVR